MKTCIQVFVLAAVLAGCGGGGSSSGDMTPAPTVAVTLPTPTSQYSVSIKDFGAVGDGAHDAQDSAAWEKAISALPENGGVIKVAAGVYGPVKVAITKKNVVLRGEGMPAFKSDSSGLIGGTIIKGPLVADADGFQAFDLGVDSGSAVVASLYAGVAQEGLSFQNIDLVVGKPARTGVVLQNISAILKSSTVPNHAVLIENVSGADVNNIHTRFGVHGIVLKAIDTNARVLFADSHGTNGVILKSDTYAPTHGLKVSDVTVTADVAESGGGVRVQAATANMSDVALSGIRTKAGNFGIIVEANTANVSGVSVKDATIQSATLYGFIAATAPGNVIENLTVDGVNVSSSGSDGFTFKGAINNSTVSNSSSVSNAGHAYVVNILTNSRFTLFNDKSANNTGYGFSWDGAAGVYFDSVSDSGSKLGLTNQPALPKSPGN